MKTYTIPVQSIWNTSLYGTPLCHIMAENLIWTRINADDAGHAKALSVVRWATR